MNALTVYDVNLIYTQGAVVNMCEERKLLCIRRYEGEKVCS